MQTQYFVRRVIDGQVDETWPARGPYATAREAWAEAGRIGRDLDRAGRLARDRGEGYIVARVTAAGLPPPIERS